MRRRGLNILTSLCGHCAVTVVALLAPITSDAADSPTGGEPGVRAFVLTTMYFGGPMEAGVCKIPSDGAVEIYLKSLPSQEQSSYAAPERRQALIAKMNQDYGFRQLLLDGDKTKKPADVMPNQVPTPAQVQAIGEMNGFPPNRGKLIFQNRMIGYSSCTNPEDFPNLVQGFHPYDGKKALGMNLDKKVGPTDYLSPDGTPGVDNQLWRVIGCMKVFAEHSDPKVSNDVFLSSRAPTIIELRGVTDARNSTNVTVNIYAAADPVTRDGQGKALAWSSFRLDPDKSLRASTHGQIIDGVLNTDPVDLKINYKEQIIDSARVIRGARIRMSVTDDGTTEGMIAGYYTLASFYDSIEQMTEVGADVNRISCPGLRQAIDQFADGFPDRKGGRNTAISSALSFVAVPAFAIDDGANQAVTSGYNIPGGPQ